MSKPQKYSIGFRLLVAQSLTILVVMGAFTLMLSSSVTRRLDQRTEDDLSRQVLLVTNSLSSYHAALKRSVDALSAVFASNFPGPFVLDELHTLPSGAVRVPTLTAGSLQLNSSLESVERFSAASQAVATVFVRSGDDFIRVATSLKKDDGSRALGTTLDRDNPAYAEALHGAQYAGLATLYGRDYMAKYTPVQDAHGKVVALFFVGLDFTDALKTLKEQLKSVKIGQSGYVFALGAGPGKNLGLLQIHPSKEGSNVLDSRDAEGRPFMKEILSRKDGVLRYSLAESGAGAKARLVSFRYLKEWNWVVCAGATLDELNQEAVLLRNTMLGASLLVVVLLLSLFVFILRRWITLPLQEALASTRLLAAGDFRRIGTPESVPCESADEVQQISRGIQEMACSLRGLLEKINSSSLDVSAAAEQMNSTAVRIAGSAQDVASQAETVATSSQQISVSSSEIAANCREAALHSSEASDTACAGTETVLLTLGGMERIEQRVRAAALTLDQLGASSEQIGAIIGTIEDIADQTNLLALNAAIEAARAGEQGRGFAVVADEVRALADRTTSATREIGAMIKAIQSGTRGAVAAMEEGVSEVEKGSQLSLESGQALELVLFKVCDVTNQVDQIATAAEQQTAATSEINCNIQQITEVMHNTVRGASESATASLELARCARELHQLAARFQL
jgi:methyl-accepting chemotaxis protein